MAVDYSLNVGLLVNPVAGIGGTVALLGSDGQARQASARALGAELQAGQRCETFLQQLLALSADAPEHIRWFTWGAGMGAQYLGAPWRSTVLGEPVADDATTAGDSGVALQALLKTGVDLLVFVGGDGTARDVLANVADRLPVLGVPAGVKMHSGVFAVSPGAAAQVLARLLAGGMVAPVLREVRDFDDGQALVPGTPAAQDTGIPVRSFGELKVPDLSSFLQHTKVGGMESEPLVVEEICAEMLERCADSAQTLVIGPGSTCLAVKNAMQVPATLRGFDVRLSSGETLQNVRSQELHELCADGHSVHVIISFTRQQGFLLGRGNQQLDLTFLRQLRWPEDVTIIASRTKISSLQGRPLLVDSGDALFDQQLCGLVEVVTGYEDRLLYRVATDLTASNSRHQPQ